MTEKSERLQKFLANQGLGSRREIERWIEEGRVTINRRTAQLGDRCTAKDQIAIDGRPVRIKGDGEQPILGLMYYKPEGEVTTRADEAGRKTVFDSLPRCPSGRWINIGRLDLNTAGLLLLTNHGELANRLMHPRYRMPREYAVRVRGEVSDEMLQHLQQGVMLEDGMARFESIEDGGGQGSNHWYHVTLTEGRNREVRRLWESQGMMVSRLIRTRYGPLCLDPKLKTGQFRDLTPAELNQLLNETGLPPTRSTLSLGGEKKDRKHAPRGGQRKSHAGHKRSKLDGRQPPRRKPRRGGRGG